MERYTPYEFNEANKKDLNELIGELKAQYGSFKDVKKDKDFKKLSDGDQEYVLDELKAEGTFKESLSSSDLKIILDELDDAVSRLLQSRGGNYKSNSHLLTATLDAGLFDDRFIRNKTGIKDFDSSTDKYYKELLKLMPELKRIY